MSANDPDHKPCCTPQRPVDHTGHGEATGGRSGSSHASMGKTTADDGARFVRLDGGTFLMGSNAGLGHPMDGEGPVRAVSLNAFAIDSVAVSNQRFETFVTDTGYVSEAEKYGWSFVFYQFLKQDHPPTQANAAAPWWRKVDGACWRHPEGPGSDTSGRENHPAVHISYGDALAYCAWADCRLPTEAEWEFAARGGLTQKHFPWGDELLVDRQHRCNIWQGEFPRHDSGEDGFKGTAPVDSFEANGFGLYNLVGNAWEWCADWFRPSHHATASFENPKGPPSGQSRVMRGGSYLCHASYCFRYRVSARSSAPPDSGTGHVGFRVARDL